MTVITINKPNVINVLFHFNLININGRLIVINNNKNLKNKTMETIKFSPNISPPMSGKNWTKKYRPRQKIGAMIINIANLFSNLVKKSI
jgi:hypothetical protein